MHEVGARGASRKGGMEGFAKQSFAGMRADEAVRASATRALPGASSTKRRGAEGRGGPWRRGACEGRSLSRGAAAGVASAAAKRVVEMPRTLQGCSRRFRHAGCESDGHRSTSGGSEGGPLPGACKEGTGGNGGDRPCLPAPVPMRPREQRGRGRERVTFDLKRTPRKEGFRRRDCEQAHPAFRLGDAPPCRLDVSQRILDHAREHVEALARLHTIRLRHQRLQHLRRAPCSSDSASSRLSVASMSTIVAPFVVVLRGK